MESRIESKQYAAVDIGASSGRVLAGWIEVSFMISPPAIRPFTIDRKNFVLIETSNGARASAKKNTKTPTLIEFIIDPEEMVYPMIKPGGTLEDMIMDC